MRFLLFFLLFAWIAYTQQASAQTYYPFPTGSAYWKYYGRDNGSRFLHYQSLELDGDTSINNKVYSRIFITELDSVVLLDTTFYSFYPRYFYGGIREENKRIYFYHPYLGSESLVFDFNHVVGDTIFYDVCQSCGLCDMILSSIDSVQLVDGSYRRRFNFYPDAMYPYIEGIGSSAGILSICVPPGGPGALSWELTCFRVHDTLLYYQNATENCSIITSVEPVVHVNNNISIHPTPFNSVVTIEFGKIIREGTLEVRNLAGQIVLKERISNSDMEIIPVECFQTNGIYFLTVKAEDKVYCSKLVCER